MKTRSRSNKNLAFLFVFYAIDLVLFLFLRSKNSNKKGAKAHRVVVIILCAEEGTTHRVVIPSLYAELIIPSYAQEKKKKGRAFLPFLVLF